MTKTGEKRPKATYVGLDVLVMGTSSAIIGSNEGTSRMLNMMMESAIEFQNYTAETKTTSKYESRNISQNNRLNCFKRCYEIRRKGFQLR